jgi:PAS domain S-box-containing protein
VSGTESPSDGEAAADHLATSTHDDLTRVLDSGPVGFVITDKSGVIEWVNTTLLDWLGRSRDELVGKRTFQELLSAGGRIYYDTHVRPMVHMRHLAKEIALELVCADDRRLSVLINASLRIDDETGVETIETFVVDATQRREYERELLRGRELAERSEARLQVMYDVASGLAEAMTVDEVISVVTARATRSINEARCAIWLIDAARGTAARGGTISDDEGGPPDELDFPDGGPALDQLAAGGVVVIGDLESGAVDYPLISQWMSEAGMKSAAIAPLLANGRLTGAMTFGYGHAHDFDEAEIRAAMALANQAEQGLERARVLEAERRSKRHLESLLEFTKLLSAALTLDEVIATIVDRGQELLGATGSRLALLDATGHTVRFVRSGAAGSNSHPDLELSLDRRSIGCEAIRINFPVSVESRDELAHLYPDSPILDHPNVGRVVAMPLRRGDEVLGAWVLADSESGPSGAVDLTMFGLFAEQAGQATQRAALHEAEALARAQADVRNEVSAALNGATTIADVGRSITLQGRAAFNATAIAFFVLDPDDPSVLHLETHSGLDESTVAAAQTIAIDGQLERLLDRKPSPRFADGPSKFDDLLDATLGTHRRGAAAVLPLRVAEHPLGLIVMSFERPDALSASIRSALSGLAAETNVALVRAREHDSDHDVATTLQRSLLPSIGDVDEQWLVTTSHEPWSELLEVGGDLFDVTSFDDGRLMLVVGDVVGHGLAAAAAMGLLRSAAKMQALVASSPAEVIHGLHEFARVTPGVRFSTVCCVEVQADGAARYSCAGHPYPVLRRPDGSTELLDGGRSPLLGVVETETTDATFHMEPGTSIVVYTDGLIERRGLVVDEGLERLRELVSEADGATGGLDAPSLVDAMFDGNDREDDVVVVCLTRLASEPAG